MIYSTQQAIAYVWQLHENSTNTVQWLKLVQMQTCRQQSARRTILAHLPCLRILELKSKEDIKPSLHLFFCYFWYVVFKDALVSTVEQSNYYAIPLNMRLHMSTQLCKQDLSFLFSVCSLCYIAQSHLSRLCIVDLKNSLEKQKEESIWRNSIPKPSVLVWWQFPFLFPVCKFIYVRKHWREQKTGSLSLDIYRLHRQIIKMVFGEFPDWLFCAVSTRQKIITLLCSSWDPLSSYRFFSILYFYFVEQCWLYCVIL